MLLPHVQREGARWRVWSADECLFSITQPSYAACLSSLCRTAQGRRQPARKPAPWLGCRGGDLVQEGLVTGASRSWRFRLIIDIHHNNNS